MDSTMLAFTPFRQSRAWSRLELDYLGHSILLTITKALSSPRARYQQGTFVYLPREE